MKYLLTVALFAGVSCPTLAQEGKPGKTDYAAPLYLHLVNTSGKDSTAAPIRISEPLFLVKYDAVTEEVTKTEFNDLAQHGTKNVESVTVLRDSQAIESYGSKGRNGVVILALKDKPTFLNRDQNSPTK